MKAFIEKSLPWVLILFGGLRLLLERFPGRLSFLRFLGVVHHGWVFWLFGLTGVVWLLLRADPFGHPVPSMDRTSGKSRLQRFFQNYHMEMLILLLTAASLSMLIRSGYYWDDAVNSTAYLAEKKDSIPTLRHVLDFMGEYLRLGRINILSVYYYFLFYIENVSVYKALIIFSILADQLVFRKVLLEFDIPLSGARLGMLLIPLMLQTRAYQDPVSGFYALMQVLTMEMLLCALFLRRFLRTGKKSVLGLSLLFFGIGLMTYEVCFPFLLMICVLIWVNRGNFGRAVRESLPFVLLTLLILAGVFYVRWRFFTTAPYAGVSFSLQPDKILRAALTQLRAGLPLSFYSAGYQASILENAYPAAEFMNYDFGSFLRSVKITDILILIGVFYVLRCCRGFDDKRTRNPELLVLGFCFAVLPVITVAMSERYQGQLMPGLGYLPVYMQYYGIAMLLLWMLLQVKNSVGVRSFCVGAFAVILLLNLQNNRAVTDLMNRSFYEPRNAGEAALRGGLLDFLPEDAVLVSLNDRRYLWEANWNNMGLYEEFYHNNTKHLSCTVGDTRLLRETVDKLSASGAAADRDGYIQLSTDNVWIIYYHGGRDRGFARLGRLRSALIDPETLEIRNAETDQVLYFVSGQYPDKAGVHYTKSDGTFRQIDPSDLQRVRSSKNGILFRLSEEEKIIFNSLSTE